MAAREALAMAKELELPDLQANALNTIGLARVLTDDFAGISDMEESLRLALEQGSLDEIARTYNNLGGAYTIEGLDRGGLADVRGPARTSMNGSACPPTGRKYRSWVTITSAAAGTERRSGGPTTSWMKGLPSLMEAGVRLVEGSKYASPATTSAGAASDFGSRARGCPWTEV